MRRLPVILLCLVPLAFGAAGCATQPVVAAEKAVASALISDEEEAKLGEQLHKELEKEGIRYVTDPQVVQYVENLARPILREATRDRRETRFHVHVVDSKDVNAFATPGGHLYVQTGLIRAAKSEAELAGVIAHEAGHVTGRHAARNMVQMYGLQAVAGLALGKDPSQLEQVAAVILANGALLRHSRQQEIEADEYGARYAAGARYDPRGLISFFATLRKLQGDMPQLLSWLSTHPTTRDRISNLQAYIKEKRLAGGEMNPLGQLAAIQQRLGGPAIGGSGQ